MEDYTGNTSNLTYALVDLIQGDGSAYSNVVSQFNVKKVQTALDFILNNPNLTDSQKTDLLLNSWRVMYKEKPPTPREFLEPKYLGNMSENIWPRLQRSFVDFWDPDAPYRHAVLYPHIGWGKLVHPEATILTPTGRIKAASIQVGDRVCTPDGQSALVLERLDWKDEELCTITFADGRSSHVGLDHYWKAAKSYNTRKWDPQFKKYIKTEYPEPCWKIISTREILKDRINNPKSRWIISLPEPVLHSARPHVIPPYSLGALLGDAYFSPNNIISLVGDDIEIHERVQEEALRTNQKFSFRDHVDQTVFYKTILNGGKDNPYDNALKELGLQGTLSNTKFIPEEYLYDSIENRIALLQGLMDTDGTVNKKEKGGTHAHFYTTSPLLRDNMLTLIRGLGGKASYHIDDRKRERCADNLVGYVVYFTFPNNNFPIFSLKRKQDLIDVDYNRDRTKRKPQYLNIESIIVDENKGPGVCIVVDHPDHLFLIDDYVVTHNSTLSVLINLYTTTHLSLMRDPKRTLNLSPASVLANVLCSFSLKKSAELLLEPFMNILDSSDYFIKVRTREDMIGLEDNYRHSDEGAGKIYWTTASLQGTSALTFMNGINFKLISNKNNLLGLSIVNGTMTELGFFRDAGKSDDYIMQFFNDLKKRIYSRMKKSERGLFFGRSILDSSPNDLDSPIDRYIMFDAEKDPKNYIVQGSVWKWAPEEYPDADVDTFPVFKGGSGKPPEILTNTIGYHPEDILQVPRQLYQYFVDDLKKSMKDLAGLPTGATDKLFYEYDKIENSFSDKLKNVYTCIRADALMPPSGLIWNQFKDQFFYKSVTGHYRFYYKPNLPRVLHFDQSISTDMTGIAAVHVERKNMAFSNELAKDLIYVVDFVVPIHPFGGRINLEAIKEFVMDLAGKGNLPIAGLSFDTFQSEANIQALERAGFETDVISVDKSLDPYMYLAQQIEQGNLKLGKNIFFKNNLKSLRIVPRDSGSFKVDHTLGDSPSPSGGVDESWENSLLGINAKDVSDAVCGAVYNAKKILATNPLALRELWDEEKVFAGPQEVKGTLDGLYTRLGVGV